MESKWRQNVPDLGWSCSDIVMAARVLGFFPVNYVVRFEWDEELWVVEFFNHPDGTHDMNMAQIPGNTFTDLAAASLIEAD